MTQSYSCANFRDCLVTVTVSIETMSESVRICSSCSNLHSCFSGSDSIPSIDKSGLRLFKFDASNLERIPRGVYSVCGWSVSNIPLFTLRIQGIESFQINYCFDQLPCTVQHFQGNPLPTNGSLVVVPTSATCDRDDLPSVHDFPNLGSSYPPTSNGSTYSFGSTPINVSYTPVQYRLCWRSPAGTLVVPAGSMIIHSFETYYRQYVVTSPDWQPYDSVLKIVFLSSVLLLAIAAAALLPPLIARIKRSRKRTVECTIPVDPIIARMCDEEVGVDTRKRLALIVTQGSMTRRMRTRLRRSQLAHEIYCVSDIAL